ncbi:hypothetical protein M378DRAFT_439381 [Amanita muscaria Koide BX008]|uniref:SWIM-type domain-containing protein n=1 Tax=Amanita muscaria (strain Koide BX008) TaxID=946122 RepID=A0A0C2X949_AMAMK|nr:hypothetical protein M378DRAFT_439381 [Amanita muscaria Koide BX008]
MASPHVADILIHALDSIESDCLSDDTIGELQFFLPENLILAALDLVDHEKVIQYITPWGSRFYQVLGSNATYSVYIDMVIAPISYYCTCPAFAYAVLLSETHAMCKHVLATWISRRLSRCLDRPVTSDDLLHVLSRQLGPEETSL